MSSNKDIKTYGIFHKETGEQWVAPSVDLDTIKDKLKSFIQENEEFGSVCVSKLNNYIEKLGE